MAVLLRTTTCATDTTADSSSTLLATTFRRGRRLLPARASPSPRLVSAEPLNVCAKASITVLDRLGDYEHMTKARDMLTEKGRGYHHQESG